MTSIFKLHHFIMLAGMWSLGNGLLHDIFVLLERKPFDKELIRLLIDGHILIFSGIVYMLCYTGIKEQEPNAYYVSMAMSVFLLGYCALIFKILPSFLTIGINFVALVWLVMALPSK